MSAVKRQMEEKRDKKTGRGSVDNRSRLDAFGNGKRKGNAEWASCDCERLQAVVEAITRLGGAVTFGLSRDQGAHSLTLMLDSNRETLWFNGNADLDEELRVVFEKLDAIET